MNPPRFYSPHGLAPSAVVALDAEESRHAARVLRLREGDAVVLFDGAGLALAGSVLSVGKSAVSVALGATPLPSRESPLRTTLIQAVAKGAKMDFVVEKAVELGVHVVLPVFAARGDVKPREEKGASRAERWRKIALAAAKQCGRAALPEIAEPMPFADAIRSAQAERKFILHPEGAPFSSSGAAPKGGAAFAVGPEGGFIEPEITTARAAGFEPLSLGPRVLRTETAGAAFLAVLQTAWGDGS